MNELTERCPLLLAAAEVKSDLHAPTFCFGERCAWWDGHNCAVLSLALNLSDLNERGIITRPTEWRD